MSNDVLQALPHLIINLNCLVPSPALTNHFMQRVSTNDDPHRCSCHAQKSGHFVVILFPLVSVDNTSFISFRSWYVAFWSQVRCPHWRFWKSFLFDYNLIENTFENSNFTFGYPLLLKWSHLLDFCNFCSRHINILNQRQFVSIFGCYTVQYQYLIDLCNIGIMCAIFGSWVPAFDWKKL